MPLPAAARILDLHDVLAAAGPARRAMLLLEAGDGLAPAAAAALPLGTADARLFDLHARWFGPLLTADARCPRCAAWLEAALDVTALAGPAAAVSTQRTVRRGKMTATVRPLRLADLAGAEGMAPTQARAALLRAGLVTLRVAGATRDVAALPAEAETWVAEALAAADPGADLAVALACDGCGTAWEERLDVTTFLVARLAALAARLIDEVHRLASAYGWSEAAILALPGARRSRYLDLAAA